MKYKLIFRTYGKPIRGANIKSHELAKVDSRIECYDIDDIKNINDIRDNDSRLVFQTQGIHLYNQKYNFLKAKPTDVIYIRHEHMPKLYPNPVNNGFSYTLQRGTKPKKFKFINSLKYCSPTLYNFPASEKSEEKVLGYYLRPTLTPDSNNWFLEFLNSLEKPVKLFTMGISNNYSGHNNVISHTHTYDRFEFFKNVTHYLYFKSNTFTDPFPHSLMEAVQSGCQIIIPENKRDTDDGIDDIQSCIQFHTSLNNEIIDNKDSLLNLNFLKYQKMLIDKSFMFTPINELKHYKNFNEWLYENIWKLNNI